MTDSEMDSIERGDEAQSLRARVAQLEMELLAKQRYEDQLRLDEQRFEALYELSQMAAASMHEVSHFALEQAVRLTGSTMGYLAFVDEDVATLSMYAWSKRAMDECAMHDKPILYRLSDTGLWGEAVRQRKAVITNDYSTDNPLCKGYPAGHVRLSRHMNVPVFCDEKIVAVVGVGNKAEPYDESDVRHLSSLANGMWSFIRHRKMEDELRAGEERYRMLIETMTDGLGIQDAKGCLVYGNRRLAEMLGYSIEEAVGRPITDFVHPDDMDLYRTQIMSRRKGGHPHPYEMNWLSKDGRRVCTLVSPAPLEPSSRVFKGAFAVVTDISRLKETENALRRSEEQLRLIFESSRDILYKFDIATGRFEYVSPSLTVMTGYSVDEFIQGGLAWLMSKVHPEDRDNVFQHHVRLTQSGVAVDGLETAEYRLRNLHGDYVWFGENCTVVNAPDGTPVSIVGSVRDITERKNGERTLLAASRMEATATLAGGIAHDFNNLMVGVLGNAELLQMHLADKPNLHRMLSGIAQAAHQAGKLAQQMLAYARGGKYQPKMINLNTVVQETLQLEKHSFPPRIQLHCDSQENLWTVNADPVQMSQIIMNLSINAVESIEGNGRITISTRNFTIDPGFANIHAGLKPGRYVNLTVVDTGKGMPSEVSAKVFEPFFTTKFQGRGLGLAAVYGIVKNHEGHISVYSEPGVGTSFKLYLPAVDTPEHHQEIKSAQDSLKLGTETVLLIDDEDVVVSVTREILEQLGYRVIVAHNGVEAVEIAETFDGRIHIALLDMGMPVMGGAQAYPLLKRARPEMSILICSGYELDPAAQDLLDQGACGFVQKPFRLSELADALRRAAEKGGATSKE